MEITIPSMEIKIAATQYPVLDIIKKRWSARAFSEQSIGEQDLYTLFEAASWSPSSMNEQPWVYVYAHRGSELFEQMWSCLAGGNQPWAKNAAVLILSLCRNQFAANQQTNFHALYDVGAANTVLLLQATTMGIYGHIMGGFDREKTKSTFAISDSYTIATFIALGYLDDPATLEEPFRTREVTPRTRKHIVDFVFDTAEKL